MKTTTLLVAIAAMAAVAIAHAEHVQTGYRTDTTLIDPGDGGCGALLLNADGTYENAYAWRYGGTAPPDYGAFVECYNEGAPVQLCSAVYDFTQVGGQAGQHMNILVYNDWRSLPGPVIYIQDVVPGTIALWPVVSRHTFPVDMGGSYTGEAWWVGYWGNWPDLDNGWYVGADFDGFGGCPYTKVVPHLGFHSGWTHVSVIWGPTQAIGIGAEVTMPPDPLYRMTWGRIKSLFN